MMTLIWLAAIGSGILAGALGTSILSRRPLVNIHRIAGSLLCGFVVIFAWWLSAPHYNPLATKLRQPIIASGAVATAICLLYKRKTT